MIERQPSRAAHARVEPARARDDTIDAVVDADRRIVAWDPSPADVLDEESEQLRRYAARSHDGWTLLPRDDRSWDPGLDDLSSARNAHRTNTADEMDEALRHGHNWLEGDLRVDGDGDLVMAHDADEEGSGLTLAEWLAIGGAGRRGLKVDVKESAAIPELLDALEHSGIPGGRIMVNVGELPVADVREIRRRLPDAWLALNPRLDPGGYDGDDLERITDLADAVGGRITFPIRWDHASDDVIDQLRPHGSVSIWTSRSGGTPADASDERERLRERGVDGMIDLGPPAGFWLRIGQAFAGLWDSDAVVAVRTLVDDATDLVADGLDAAQEGVRAVGRALESVADRTGDVIHGAGDALGDLLP